jgi:AraC family transcriptional regulator
MKLEAGRFFGSTVQQRDVRGFSFTAREYEGGLRIPLHSHELAHFCLVVDGSYEEKTQGLLRDCLASTLIFYPPDTFHCEKHLTRGHHFLIEIKAWRWDDVREFIGQPKYCKDYAAKRGSFGLATRLYKEFCNPDQFSDLAMEGIALDMLVDMSRESPKTQGRTRWLTVVEEMIAESLDLSWSLKRLAKDIGVHPAHLARVFRQTHGCSVGEYVRKLRVELACRKIIASCEPLTRIALETGFVDQSHFSRSFKRVMGVTPSQFQGIYHKR